VRVLSGLLFFPRGGSATVARALAGELPAHGWDVTLVSGSTGAGLGDAEAFYDGLDVLSGARTTAVTSTPGRVRSTPPVPPTPTCSTCTTSRR
jgi:hypothetical protein